MTSGPEHFFQAESLLNAYAASPETVAKAQVHATLALAAATICAGNARTEIHGDGATYADVAQGADWAEVLS